MMRITISIFCLALTLFSLGCTKDKSAEDPCENLLSEMQPENVMLKFVDKNTGTSIIGPAGLTKEKIVVTDLASDKIYQDWGIVKQPILGEPNTVLQIFLFPKKAGAMSYKINLAEHGEVILNLTVTSHESSSPCKSFYLKSSNFEIDGKEYTYMEHQVALYKNLLIIKI